MKNNSIKVNCLACFWCVFATLVPVLAQQSNGVAVFTWSEQEPSNPFTANFHLALSAEKKHQWQEAIDRFEECLKLEPSAEETRKIVGELANLRWIIAFEATPSGQTKKQYDDLLIASVSALEEKNFQLATGKANEAVQINPDFWRAYALYASGLVAQGKYAEASTALKMAIERAPAEEKEKLNSSLVACENKNAVAQAKETADDLFLKKKRTQAAAAYEKAWNLDPAQSELAVWGIKSYLLAENYPKAKALLVKAKAYAPENKVFSNSKALMAKLNSLEDVDSKPKSTSSSKSRKTIEKKPKTMAEKFLDRIK